MTMTQETNHNIPPNPMQAAFYRGGTSNALMIQKSHLPDEQSEWEPILAGALGSPDPYGRQLNGMGGGYSSLSKVCVISPSERADADVEYTFVQLSIKTGRMDLSGTCGNMLSAIGPFVIDEGIVNAKCHESHGKSQTTVRVYNTNIDKIIYCTFDIDKETHQFNPVGDFAIDGVPGTSSRIMLQFLKPGGAKTGKTLPTGKPTESLDLTALSLSVPSRSQSIPVTMLDVGNPAVIVSGYDFGIGPNITPDELDADHKLLELLEQIRREGARLMGMDPEVGSIPKMVMVFPPPPDADGVHLIARVLSMGQAHRAIPLTIALNLGVACQISGTLPHSTLKGMLSQGEIVIGHPSGKIEVGASMQDGDVHTAILYRTARVLMRGAVYWR